MKFLWWEIMRKKKFDSMIDVMIIEFKIKTVGLKKRIEVQKKEIESLKMKTDYNKYTASLEVLDSEWGRKFIEDEWGNNLRHANRKLLDELNKMRELNLKAAQTIRFLHKKLGGVNYDEMEAK